MSSQSPLDLDVTLGSNAQSPPSKPALGVGDPLQARPERKVLAQALERAVQQGDGKGVRYIHANGNERFQPYRALWQQARQILAGLQALGLQPQDKVIFQIDANDELIPALWACFLGGLVPVPLTVVPAYEANPAAIAKLQGVWDMLEQPLVLSGTAPMEPLKQAAAQNHWRDFRVATVASLKDTEPVAEIYPAQPEDLALLLLTSGSTGLPKGVMLSHRNLLSMTAGTTQMNGFTDAVVALNWMPSDHVGSIVSIGLLAVDLGCHQIFVPTEYILQQPLRLLELIERHRVTMSWAPNFAFALINQQLKELRGRRYQLSSLRFLVNAGEQIAIKTVREFLQLLQAHGMPADALRPAFGMSETCSGISYSSGLTLSELRDENPFLPLGQPIPGATLRIVDDHQQVLATGETGRLQVKGPSVTRGYYRNPERNREAFTADGWFATGDLGYLDAAGQLVLTGRDKQDIIINGINYYAHEIESTVEDLEGVAVSYSAAFAVREPAAETDVLGLIFSPISAEPGDWPALVRAIRGQVAQRLGIAPRYVIPLEQERIPKTSIGKIQRSQLQQQFTAGAFDERLQQLEALMAAARAATPATSLSDAEQQVAEVWQRLLNLPAVGRYDNFFELGGHSLLLVQAQHALERAFQRSLPLTELFKHPTVAALAEYLSAPEGDDQAVQSGQHRAHRRRTRGDEQAVAIIGMACRFPGANDTESFWDNLAAGVESITVFSDAELATVGVDRALRNHPDYVKARPIIEGIEAFDAGFFGFNAREAALLDPQHRLMLECSWECFEQAGYDPLRYPGSVGIYAGAGMNTYLLNNVYLQRQALDPNDALQAATLDSFGGFQIMVAHDKDYLPTRVAYKLNLRGPAVNVQTACSTGLVAVHLAVQSLLSGESDLSLAGCAAVNTPQTIGYLFQEGMITSPDGHCRAFDAQAAGTVFGSGVAAVLLKRLDEALAAGDVIHGVIKGTAINNDGGSKLGYTAPSGVGQAAVVAEALAVADVDPATIGLLEAHGTGTVLGDPVEVGALTQAFRAHTARTQFCALGSVKANVGHLQITSGLAGLIKAVLALKHRAIPPLLHLQSPNPQIDFNSSPFYLNTTLQSWPQPEHNGVSQPRRAGVSSLGIGGTNANVILEEAPERDAVVNAVERPCHLLRLAAKSEAALQALAARFADYLAAAPEADLGNICFTANTGRSSFDYRLAVSGVSSRELSHRLRQLGTPDSGIVTGQVANQPPRIAFLCTGQGSQYAGMGRALYATQPTFRAALERCAELLQDELEVPLLEVLYGEPDTTALLDRTAYTQPALFALEYALAVLWQSWGVKPDAVLGHSVGEYVAACIAGVFSLEEGLKLIAARARLMQRLPAGGAMVAVLAPEAPVRAALQSATREVAIAAVNGPQQVVISGAAAAVEAVVERLQAAGIQTRPLSVSHAFHSPLMAPMVSDFAEVARRIAYRSPQLPLVSNVSGDWGSDEPLTADYWCRHIRQPVRFAAGMEALHRHGCELFIELGPQPVLLGMGRQCLEADTGVWLPSLRPEQDWQALLESLAALYVRGVAIDWAGFDRDYARRKVVLPTYPFQRQRYWIEATPRTALKPAQDGAHPLLGQRLRLAGSTEWRFESRLSPAQPAYLADHRVFDHALLPAAAYLEMALSAGAAALDATVSQVVEDVVLHQGLVLSAETPHTLQCVLTPEEGQRASWQLFSAPREAAEPRWTLHASGQLRQEQAQPPAPVELSTLRERFAAALPVEEHYRYWRERGLDYGPGFQTLTRLWASAEAALGEIQLPAGLAAEVAQYHFHPALLDGCFQVLLAVLASATEATYLPVGFEHLAVYRRPSQHLWSHAQLRLSENRLTATGDIQIFDANGAVVLEGAGLALKQTDASALLADPAELLYQVSWRPQALYGVADYLPPLPQLQAMLPPTPVLAEPDQLLSRLEALSVEAVRAAFQQLGWHGQPAQRFSRQQLADQLGIAPTQQRLLGRLLEILTEAHLLRRLDQEWEILRMPPAADLKQGLQSLRERYPAAAAELTLWGRCAPQLADVLTGRCDPLPLVFPQGDSDTATQLYQDSLTASAANRQVRHVLTQILAHLPAGRGLRILELGAGTGGTTAHLLPLLPAGQIHYLFTDISNLFTTQARERFQGYPFVEYRTLDIEQNPGAQGFAEHHYDLIVAANVLHATQALRQTLGHVRQLLAPGGVLVLLEATERRRWIDLIFGLLEGWWRFSDHDLRPDYPLLTAATWQNLLSECGFSEAITVPVTTTAEGALAPQTVLVAKNAPTEADPWLVLADSGGLGQQLATQLRARGDRCTLVVPGPRYQPQGDRSFCIDPTDPADYRQVLQALPTVQGVVQLWGLEGDTADLAQATQRSCASTLYLVQALAAHAITAPLWLVTRGAQAVAEGTEAVSGIAQAPLWGLGKVIALEHPELKGRRIDLDPALPLQEAARTLLAELVAPAGPEDQIAWRGPQRYVARLSHWPPLLDESVQLAITRRDILPASSMSLHKEGTYLITGGLGGLGWLIADWLVKQGARHLLLLGRRAPNATAQTRLAALEQAGAHVTVAQADVAQRHQLATALAKIDNAQPLRGVIHAAGVLDDGILLQQDWARFVHVLAPKVQGAWHLHELTQDQPLDFFVLFSSAASLLGSSGQANHAAANAFLDALAHYRQAQGLPALAINWGAWSEVGAAAKRLEQITLKGMGVIAPDRGLRILHRLLSAPVTQVGVVPIDWSQFRMTSPFLADIQGVAGVQEAQPTLALKQQLAAAPSDQRRALLLAHVQSLVAAVLGHQETIAVEPSQKFLELGMDSLTSMELRNRLQTSLGHRLPSTLIFDYPTLEELVDVLMQQQGGQSGDVKEVVRQAPDLKAPPERKDRTDRVVGYL